jgi:hypothetical protein
LYIAKSGTKHINNIRSAVQEHGSGDEIKKHIERHLKHISVVSTDELPELMLQQPVLADIRYGGDTLIHGFFLPEGVDLFLIPLAYNGGGLAREGFTLFEHYQEGSAASFEAIVVRSAPKLTTAEEAALRMVPATQLINNVAVLQGWCDTTWWVVAKAVIIALAVTVEATCICAAMDAVTLSEERLKELGPAASARELTKLRTEVLVKVARTK